MIYELRVYTCLPGRLPALLKRFDTHTLRIFERLGIRQAGFWTTMVGASSNELSYLLAWESLGDRQQRWGTFVSDPEWLAVQAESEKDGLIIANINSSFLKPTSFSSVK